MQQIKYFMSDRFLGSGAYFTKEAIIHEKNKSDVTEYYNFILPSGIISIITFLESYINEYYLEIVDQNEHTPNTVLIENKNEIIKQWPKIEKYSILDKYDKLITITDGKNFDKRTYPYQDVYALIQLRNALIHYKPEWQKPYKEKENKQLEILLRNKFKLSPYYDSNNEPFYPYLCLSADCLFWSLNCSMKLVSSFNNRITSSVSLVNIFNASLIKVNSILAA